MVKNLNTQILIIFVFLKWVPKYNFWIKISTNEQPHSIKARTPQTDHKIYDDELLFSIHRVLCHGYLFKMGCVKQSTYI